MTFESNASSMTMSLKSLKAASVLPQFTYMQWETIVHKDISNIILNDLLMDFACPLQVPHSRPPKMWHSPESPHSIKTFGRVCIPSILHISPWSTARFFSLYLKPLPHQGFIFKLCDGPALAIIHKRN
jgi:hypothetical protein